MDETETKVIFRTDKSGDFAGEVTAIFPELEANRGMYMCYVHVGQHSEGTYNGLYNNTRPSTPEEFAPLKKELEQIGYKLKVIKRMPPR